MKQIALSLAGLFLATGLAFANCGSCPASKAAAGEAHVCSMHADKNATLVSAAEALKSSNPELAGKLEDMAKNCCGGSHS